MYIYKTTNKLNGKIYIGLSKFAPQENPEYLGSGYILKKAIECYGAENFVKVILEECSTQEELLERERYWIATLKANDRNVGYNICEGGTWGDNWTNHPNKEEWRKKLSESNRGEKNGNYGNRWTDEQKRKASERVKLNPIGIDPKTGERYTKNPETRKKLSDTKLGLNNPHSNLWKLVSPIGEIFIIEGGIKKKIKECGSDYQQFKHALILPDGGRRNLKGWTLYKLEKSI